MKWNILIVALVTSLLLTGCIVSTSTVKPMNTDVLRGKTIALVPQDTLTHPTNANTVTVGIAFNMLESLMKLTEEKLSTHKEFMYPTGILGEKLVSLIKNKYDMRLKPYNSQTDYKLEVKTHWYTKAFFGKTKFNMENIVELKDSKTDKTVSYLFCGYAEVYGVKLAEYDASVLWESGIHMKSILTKEGVIIQNREANKAIDLCVEKFITEIL